jgi:hypothetical protein
MRGCDTPLVNVIAAAATTFAVLLAWIQRSTKAV